MSSNNSGFWFACVDIKVLTDKSLSPIDKVVYAVLCAHADTDSKKCILKIDTIAEEACCSSRSVKNSLKKLGERGIIKRTERFFHNRQIATGYEVIGYKAECYAESSRGAGDSPLGCTSCTQNESLYNNDIKDSLTREAKLPDAETFPAAFEDEQPITPVDSHTPRNPEEIYSPDDAPDIMKPTSELLLHKTGRQGLTWDEISALRELSASQYPSRVQKEIYIAVNRFLKRGQPLSELTMCYIAGSLRHQPTRGRMRKLPKAPTPPPVPECTDEQAEAEMAEIEAFLAKFDAERRAHGF